MHAFASNVTIMIVKQNSGRQNLNPAHHLLIAGSTWYNFANCHCQELYSQTLLAIQH